MKLLTLFLTFFIVVFASPALGGNLPDTGQTKCYDDNGKEISPCPKEGEPFYGQDAHYSIHPMSFTKLDSRGKALAENAKEWVMVKDNHTGLIWEVKTDDGSVHDKDNQYTWEAAQDEFIQQLNKERFGGFSDWRVPTREELRTIVNYGEKGDPTIYTTYFPKTVSSVYWASETCAWNSGSAWGVNFYNGYAYNYAKSESWYVRAVRGGE